MPNSLAPARFPHPGDFAARAQDTLTAALVAIREDYNANWRYAPSAEGIVVEDAINALDDLVGRFIAAMPE